MAAEAESHLFAVVRGGEGEQVRIARLMLARMYLIDQRPRDAEAQVLAVLAVDPNDLSAKQMLALVRQ